MSACSRPACVEELATMRTALVDLFEWAFNAVLGMQAAGLAETAERADAILLPRTAVVLNAHVPIGRPPVAVAPQPGLFEDVEVVS